MFLFHGSQILVNVDIRVKDKGRVKSTRKYYHWPRQCSNLRMSVQVICHPGIHITFWDIPLPSKAGPLRISHPGCLHIFTPQANLLQTQPESSHKALTSSSLPLNLNRIIPVFPQSKHLTMESQHAKRIIDRIFISLAFVDFQRTLYHWR